MSKVSGHLRGLLGNILGGGSTTRQPVGTSIKKEESFEFDTSQFSHTKENKYSFGTIQYPEDLTNDDMGHYMLFYIYRTYNSKYGVTTYNSNYEPVAELNTGISYSKRNDFTEPPLVNKNPKSSSTVRNQLGFKKTSDAIALYMPPNLKTTYNAGYRDSELGLAGEAAKRFGFGPGATAGDILDRMGEQGTGFLNDLIIERGVKGGALALGDLLGAGDATGTLRLLTQKAINPHLEAIFDKVDFRTFNYTFRFTPRNKKEVLTVDNIIKLFKFHMLPERDGYEEGRYLIYPSEFEIHFMYKGVENTWLPFISNCVLTSVDVNYGPDGQYQTFEPMPTPDGDAPPVVTTEMTLSFKEVEIMTKERIKQGF